MTKEWFDILTAVELLERFVDRFPDDGATYRLLFEALEHRDPRLIKAAIHAARDKLGELCGICGAYLGSSGPFSSSLCEACLEGP